MRSLLTSLIVLLLALRSLLPVGFMPAVSTEGAMTIVICDASGGRHVIVDRNGTPLSPDAPSDDERIFGGAGLCAQLSTSWAAIPPAHDESARPFIFAQSYVLVPYGDVVSYADPLGSNSARGPPAARI